MLSGGFGNIVHFYFITPITEERENMNSTQIILLCLCGAVFLFIAVIAAIGNSLGALSKKRAAPSAARPGIFKQPLYAVGCSRAALTAYHLRRGCGSYPAAFYAEG